MNRPAPAPPSAMPHAALSRWAEPLRFALVGLANTGVDFLLFVALHRLAGLDPLVANALAFAAAVANSYVLNKRFTFRDASPFSAGEAVRFALVALGGLAISTLLIAVLGPRLTPEIAKAIAILATFVWNYVVSRRLVFGGSAQ